MLCSTIIKVFYFLKKKKGRVNTSMSLYKDFSTIQLQDELNKTNKHYNEFKAKGLKLNLARGKPGADQIEISKKILDVLSSSSNLKAENGMDVLNYGELSGIIDAKKFMADILEVDTNEIFIGGNSSLNLMHDCMAVAYIKGMPNSTKPWGKLDNVKFLCPSPGYDRHFAVSEHFGFELITVPMLKTGPDMDAVEKLIERDESIKGMWCVPKYSNPTGITYSDDTVKRIAQLKPAAGDFTIFWDNAYVVHHLYPENPDKLLSLFALLKKNNNENMLLMFSSTSKLTFPGGGISAIGANEEMINYLTKHFSLQTIGYDKINQLSHARYFKENPLSEHMAKHAEILRPKFDLVLNTLEKYFANTGIAKWDKPNGGYFISLDILAGCAKRAYSLCKEAGLIITPAGATFPYGKDPKDQNIRIAPTFANLDELKQAMELLCISCKKAVLEKLQ